MSKVDIKRLDSVTKNDTTATEQINDNFQALQAAIENTVSRDGTVPNYMDADLDLNSYRIINAAAPVEGKDVVTLEYFEEKAGGAIEAAAEAKASASKAASSAQSALVASNNAIGQLAQAEGLLTATKQFVDTAKEDINSAVDEATMNISNIVSDAEGSITNIAVTEANKAIANAAQEATDTATANLNSYVDGTVKPSLQTYVDQAQAGANSAATSMEQAALSATAASNYASNASADADNAAESAGLAATSAADSEHYSEDSRKWAEGTDSEVQGLGGVHSSKVWSETAQAVVEGKQDIATAVNYNNITNCITEIPQDIKLELNNGTLTLKAGSKIYVPNGKNADGSLKFDVIVIKTDTTVITANSTGKWTVLCTGKSFRNQNIGTCYSGTTAPTVSEKYAAWYDTTNNIIKLTNDTGATWVAGSWSLPICSTTTTAGVLDSIDQIFNGFGYIGSTVFALPGVKGLAPNGRNADGSLKNIEFTVGNVVIQTTTDSFTNMPFVVNADAIQWINYLGEFSTPPSVQQYKGYFNPIENKMYFASTADGWTQIGRAFAGIVSSNGKITSFTPKTTFHAVDWSDLPTITYWE